MKAKLAPYFPGIILFFAALFLGLIVLKDYGVAWDEPLQRGPGLLSYNYVFHGDKDLFLKPTDNHGAGFELPLIIIEKWLKLTDKRDIYMMRHVVTHVLFLLGAFAAYALSYRLFKNKFLAIFAFLFLAFAPRFYAHSFFNSKDLPFLSVFIITLLLCQMAFQKNKPLLFALLGLACGYATSIRIMGIMLGSFIFGFLILDMIFNAINKEKPAKTIINTIAFTIGFCFLLFIAWPYLWVSPIKHFTESFSKLSKFDLWQGSILIGGKYIQSTEITWTYFTRWFFISNPILILIIGFTGMVMIISAFIKNPLQYLKNTPERNYLLYVGCFLVPIFAVFFLHSIIYDDWRHLYFIYPSFLMMGIYAINQLLNHSAVAGNKRNTMIVQAVCGLQFAAIAFFMVKSHPFQQVYFNELVSHEEEYLRKNYEMDYWGVSNLQALKYILDADQRKEIMVTSIYPEILQNNIDFMEEEERVRLKLVHPDSADYLITNFRFHPDDFPYMEEHSDMALNSTVIRVYRLKNYQFNVK